MAKAKATGTGWITMNHRLSITTAALLATLSLPAFAQSGAPMRGAREYVVAALAALGVILLSLFVLALVRGRRRRLAELANPPRPLDISKRHIILSREMPREQDDDALPEAPPPASIRTPIVPASSPFVAESRTPTAPPSQPRPASKPQGDLAAAMLRATAPPPPPPASQRQWLSQRPAAMAKER
jgi:hypothetical protein